VPQTTLALTDRLAVRIYVNNSGRTIKLHTENGHLCEVITTFSTGLTALNGLTAQVQSFATGTSGTDFAISSTTATHTFNLPTASAANRGALSSTDWSTFNGKFTLPALTSGSVLFSNGTTIAQDNSNLFWDDTNNRLGIGTAVPSNKLHVSADTNSIIGLGRFENTNVGTAVQSRFQLVSGTAIAQFGLFGSGHSTNPRLFRISGSSDGGDMYLATAGIDRFAITIAGNVLINTTTDAGFKLDVNGTARVGGVLTVVGNILPSAGATYNVGSGGISFSSGYFKNTVYSNQFASFDSHLFLANSGVNFARFTNTTGNLIIQNGGTYTDIASARLTVNSTTQGFLPPRMTNAQRLAIATPAVGLMVYCTDVVEGLYINKSTGWTFII
jgi:hypothetical protein